MPINTSNVVIGEDRHPFPIHKLILAIFKLHLKMSFSAYYLSFMTLPFFNYNIYHLKKMSRLFPGKR